MARLMIPKKVIIGPYEYVIECSDKSRAILGLDFGETDIEKLEIRLHPDRHPQVQKETLLHETLHACMNVAALDHELGEELEEKVVRRLTPVLMCVLTRNPAWLKVIIGGKSE